MKTTSHVVELKGFQNLSHAHSQCGFSPDGKMFVTVDSRDGHSITQIWDAHSGKELQKWKGYIPSFSSNGKIATFARVDGMEIVQIRTLPCIDIDPATG